MGIFAVPKILLFLVGESQCFRVFDIQTFGKNILQSEHRSGRCG